MKSNLSHWPLTSDGIRFLVPEFIVSHLSENRITQDCFPLALGYYPVASGHRMRRKQHTDNLLIYCTDGIGTINANGDSYTVSAGDIIILPEDVQHSYSADKKHPWSIYWVHFTGYLCDEFMAAMEIPIDQCSVFRAGTKSKLIADFESLLEVRKTGYNPKNFVLAANILRQILSYLAIAKSRNLSARAGDLDIETIHAFMQERLHGHLDLDTLAEKVSLSKYHFSNKYKLLTGQSPIQHFLHLKMEHACYLLDVSGISVKDVSISLGYEDSYYFSRIFKKIIGVSPKQYRLLQRG